MQEGLFNGTKPRWKEARPRRLGVRCLHCSLSWTTPTTFSNDGLVKSQAGPSDPQDLYMPASEEKHIEAQAPLEERYRMRLLICVHGPSGLSA